VGSRTKGRPLRVLTQQLLHQPSPLPWRIKWRKEKGFLGIGSSSGKMIQFDDEEAAIRVANRLTNAYEMHG
jgi:hypothetical protein